MRRAFGNNKKPSSMVRKGSKKEGGYSNLSMVVGLALILLVLSCGCYYYKPELFTNMLGGPKIKDLDVMFFMKPSCPHCVRMVDVMRKENTLDDVTVIDVTKPEGLELAKKYGAINRGVPSFISKKLSTGTVGYKDSTKKIVAALTEGQGNSAPQAPAPAPVPETPAITPDLLTDLKIVVFVSQGCGWCKKAKEEAQQKGVMPYLELQDIGTPEGKATLAELVGEGNFKGAPTFCSRKTGKTAVGYRPFEQVVAAVQ